MYLLRVKDLDFSRTLACALDHLADRNCNGGCGNWNRGVVQIVVVVGFFI